MITDKIVSEAKQFMKDCTEKNKAPARELTEIAIQYGNILSKEYDIQTNKVLLALYLAHCVFSNVRGSVTMKSHTVLSSEKARERLQEKNISKEDINDICKAIELHHTVENSGSLFCEVVKNSESFKFLTYKGLFVFIHHLGERGLNYEESKNYAIHKAKEKESYLTLDKAIKLAKSFIKDYEQNI